MLLIFSAAALAAPPPPLTSEMHARFDALTSARDAIIAGKLPDAKLAIASLTTPQPNAPFPTAWAPMLREVESAAKRFESSPDLASASDAIADVAVACAKCHIATGGGPLASEAAQIPAQKWSVGQNMPLHRWSADWMWLGLLSNDTDAWERGATELDNQPLAMMFDAAPPPSGMRAPSRASAEVHPEGLAREKTNTELEQLVYVIASKALTTEDLAARGVLYGDLVGTCSQCHLKRPPAKGAQP